MQSETIHEVPNEPGMTVVLTIDDNSASPPGVKSYSATVCDDGMPVWRSDSYVEGIREDSPTIQAAHHTPGLVNRWLSQNLTILTRDA